MSTQELKIKNPQDILAKLASLCITPKKWSVDHCGPTTICRFITKDGGEAATLVNFFTREIHFGVEYLPAKKCFRASFLIPSIHTR